MLRAMVFDFDGILVDSEGIVFRLTQEMAAQEGWTVSEEDYYRDYLALDDRGIIDHLYRSHGRAVNPARRDELVRWKYQKYQDIIRDGLPPFPGAVEFVRTVAQKYSLAIATGSWREEIEHLLGKLGLREKFSVLATADDCERSKPDPQVYRIAFDRLRQLPVFQAPPLSPGECLAVEDAPLGVKAAHGAGLKCLALAHSRPPEELRHADWVARKFQQVQLAEIEEAFELPPSSRGYS